MSGVVLIKLGEKLHRSYHLGFDQTLFCSSLKRYSILFHQRITGKILLKLWGVRLLRSNWNERTALWLWQDERNCVRFFNYEHWYFNKVWSYTWSKLCLTLLQDTQLWSLFQLLWHIYWIVQRMEMKYSVSSSTSLAYQKTNT